MKVPFQPWWFLMRRTGRRSRRRTAAVEASDSRFDGDSVSSSHLNRNRLTGRRAVPLPNPTEPPIASNRQHIGYFIGTFARSFLDKGRRFGRQLQEDEMTHLHRNSIRVPRRRHRAC